MKRRGVFAVVVGLVLAGITTGFAVFGQEASLRVTQTFPCYTDPAVGSDFSSTTSILNLYDSLVYPTPDGGVKPHAAVSWDTSEDGLTYTFRLREGIKFHDDSEMTAEDVAFSMTRLLEIGEGFAYIFLNKIQDVEVVDQYTVRFHLSKPYGPFVNSLIRLYIVNKDLVMANLKQPGMYGEFGDYGKEFLQTSDAGSGAYMIKDFQWEDSMLLERFPGYWGEVAPNAAPLVRQIRRPDPVTIRTLMARRELEITDQWMGVEVFDALDQIEGVKVVGWAADYSFFHMLHNNRAPTDDIHFRKALSYCWDYQEAIDSIFIGATQSHGPVSSIVSGYKEVFQYSRDLDKARAELLKSKYYDQLDKITVIYGSQDQPALQKAALLFQANAAEIGIDVEIVTLTWLKVVEQAGDMENTPHVLGIWVGPPFPEAGPQLESKYHSRMSGTWQQTEWLLSPLMDQLIDDALATTDTNERFEKYGLIQDIAVQAALSIFVFDEFQRHAYQEAYVSWPQSVVQIPAFGYHLDYRFIEVFPERKP